MIDAKDLWIGDHLKVTKTSQIGTFEGLDQLGNVKLSYNKAIHHHSPVELEIYAAPPPSLDLIFEDVKSSRPKESISKAMGVLRQIDLHIEKLNPDFKNSHAQTVLDYQLKMAEEFIKTAISKKYYKVTIIHGKGEGKLMTYIHNMLDGYVEVKMKVTINQDGATEVWLSY
jgi:hypothetical protein